MRDPGYDLRLSCPQVHVLLSVSLHKHAGVLIVYMPVNKFPITDVNKEPKAWWLKPTTFYYITVLVVRNLKWIYRAVFPLDILGKILALAILVSASPWFMTLYCSNLCFCGYIFSDSHASFSYNDLCDYRTHNRITQDNLWISKSLI